MRNSVDQTALRLTANSLGSLRDAASPVGSGASPRFRPRLRPALAPPVATATGRRDRRRRRNSR